MGYLHAFRTSHDHAARGPGLLRLTALSAFALALVLLHSLAQSAQAATTVISVTPAAPFRFSSSVTTISAGDTVRWTPQGTTPHTITSDGCGNFMAGACVFDSGTEQFIRGGTERPSFEFTFNQPGVYAFFCRLHGGPGGVGQSGVIVVQGAGQAAPEVPPPAPSVRRPPLSLAVYSPAEGQTVVGDRVRVDLGINGATARAPVTGNVDPRNGHFNLFLDQTVDLAAQTNVGGTDVTDRSFTFEGVAPGAHTLMVVWTYDNNISPQPPIASTVRFTTVAAPAAAAPAAPAPSQSGVRPPSTGDGGLATGEQGSLPVMALACLGLLLATGALLFRLQGVTASERPRR